MFCRPTPPACWLWGKVIEDGVMSGIADDIQIRVLFRDTCQIFFRVPTVTEENHVFLRGKPRHGLPYHGGRKFQLGCFPRPHTVSQRDSQINNALFFPYRYTEHEADKAMPIEVIGAIMRCMVEQF